MLYRRACVFVKSTCFSQTFRVDAIVHITQQSSGFGGNLTCCLPWFHGLHEQPGTALTHLFVKVFFNVFDGLLRFSGRKPISESKCLLAAGERHDSSNISFLQRTAYVFADTNNSLRGTKHVFQNANIAKTAKSGI